MFAVNVKTALFTSRAAIPFLKASGQGRIINIGANGALKAGAGMGAYAASKSGVHRLTESLAEELKADGITVNAVLPSTIDTPANRAKQPATWSPDWCAVHPPCPNHRNAATGARRAFQPRSPR